MIISYSSMILHRFTPFRSLWGDAQSNGSNPVISAPERGILNEKWCKYSPVYMAYKIEF